MNHCAKLKQIVLTMNIMTSQVMSATLVQIIT